MSILLHQSAVIFGINFSIADFFCIFILMVFLIKNQLYIPIAPFVFFLLVSFLVLATAVIFVPYKFHIFPDPLGIFSEYAKLIAIVVYFIIGYNLARENYTKSILKWYSYFGIMVGLLGILLTLFSIKVFSEILFYANIRYRGLMIDPNYFAVLQVSALVYISRQKTIKARYKMLTIILTAFSVLISGSKTGIVTLISYLSLRIIEYIFQTNKKIKSVGVQLLFLALLILLVPVFSNLFQSLVNSIAAIVPSFARVQYLFTDFSQAIAESGSGRDGTWGAAIEIIQLSPLFGTGIGTYTDIADKLFHLHTVAHNTFLQISAEWGIPLAFALFFYIFMNLGKVTFTHEHHSETNLILRDIVLILLIGSVAISLNNARLLWLFLGALIYSIDRGKTGIRSKEIHWERAEP